MAHIPTMLTPLFASIGQRGAKFTDLAGWRLAEVYTSVEAEVKAAKENVALADTSPHGKLMVQGDAAVDVVVAAWGCAPETIGAAEPYNAGHVYRLREDMFFVHALPGYTRETQVQFEAAMARIGGLVTATDLSHALAEIRLIGPSCRGLLARLCALDFQPVAFANRTAKQTSLAKTRQLVIRDDIGTLPAYRLAGAQSLAAYVWQVLFDAGQDFGITPIGTSALAALERNA